MVGAAALPAAVTSIRGIDVRELGPHAKASAPSATNSPRAARMAGLARPAAKKDETRSTLSASSRRNPLATSGKTSGAADAAGAGMGV